MGFKGFNGFQVVSSGFKGFQVVSRGFKWFQGVSMGFKGVSRGFNGFPSVNEFQGVLLGRSPNTQYLNTQYPIPNIILYNNIILL
jgi:hypothetical protein